MMRGDSSLKLVVVENVSRRKKNDLHPLVKRQQQQQQQRQQQQQQQKQQQEQHQQQQQKQHEQQPMTESQVTTAGHVKQFRRS